MRASVPAIKPQPSPAPEKLVRELTFRVRLRGKDVPAKAGSIEVGLCPPGAIDISDPLGSVVPPTATAAVPLPAGSYEDTVLEVELPATPWLQAAREAAAKGVKEQAEAARAGLVLPGTVSVAIRYQAAAGQVEVRQAELLEPGPAAPNLLPHGGFQSTDAVGYPLGWEQPVEVSAPARPALLRLQHLARRALRQPRPRRPGHGWWSIAAHGSLKMIVAAGNEKAVASGPVVLNQKEPRLIEVSAWVKTDRLCMLQIDAVSDKGERLDGYNFITMAPNSIGTDDSRSFASCSAPGNPCSRCACNLAPAASTAIRWTTPARSRRTTSPAPSGGMTSSSRNRKAPPRSWLPVE